MKSTIDQLTPKDRIALAHWYGTESYNALKKLLRLEIEGLGKDALGSPNHEQTKYFAGEAAMAAKIPKIVKQLSIETDKVE